MSLYTCHPTQYSWYVLQGRHMRLSQSDPDSQTR